MKSKTRSAAPTVSAHCRISAGAQLTLERVRRRAGLADDRRARHPDVIEPDLGVAADQVKPMQAGHLEAGRVGGNEELSQAVRRPRGDQQPVAPRPRPRPGSSCPSSTNSSPSARASSSIILVAGGPARLGHAPGGDRASPLSRPGSSRSGQLVGAVTGDRLGDHVDRAQRAGGHQRAHLLGDQGQVAEAPARDAASAALLADEQARPAELGSPRPPGPVEPGGSIGPLPDRWSAEPRPAGTGASYRGTAPGPMSVRDPRLTSPARSAAVATLQHVMSFVKPTVIFHIHCYRQAHAAVGI